MRLFAMIMVFACLVFAAGCTIQSDVVLPDAQAAGDPIIGFPDDKPFNLESFDREKGAYHLVGTMTPAKAEKGMVQYMLALNEDSDRIAVRAKKLSENDYVLRYAEIGHPEPNASETALVFLTVEDGTYYVLTNLADKALFEKVFPAMPRPAIVNDGVQLSSDAQVAQLSAYFRDHRADFRPDQDYIRMRIAK
jgi:hypothetical protein